MIDYNDIKQSIATNLPDNKNREITAAKLRDTLNEFVDKVEVTETGIEGDITTSVGELESETNTKIAGLRAEVNAAVASIKPIEITGNVTNAPDEEDVTSVNVGGTDVLKFKDKPYTPLTYSGIGRKILRKNIVNGVNTLTQSMIQDANTIYVIQYDFILGEDITVPTDCVLEFKGGSIGGAHTFSGNNTYIDSDSICIKKDVTITGTWNNDTIYTRWFEFVSTDDGTSDNLIVFRQLRNVINGTNGCKVEFEHGYYQYGCDIEPVAIIDGIPKYLTNRTNTTKYFVLSIMNIPYIDINLNGSTIKALTTNAPAFSFIAFVNISNASIHDGSIIGFANTFTYPTYIRYDDKQVRSYEWSHAVVQYGGFLTIKNMNISNFHGDGLMIGSFIYRFEEGASSKAFPAKGYLVENSEVSYCARNGITLHSSDIGTLKNVHIHNIGSDGESGTIGSDGIMGTSPRAGIDVEFEDGQGLIPIIIWENLYIHDCKEKSFVFAAPTSSKMKSFSCKDSMFLGFGVPNNMNSELGNNVFDNCYFKQTSFTTSKSLYGAHITYNDCSFVIDKGNVMIGNYNTFNNCSFIDERPGTSEVSYLIAPYEQLETKFNCCSFNIKRHAGYLGSKSKFSNCTFNIHTETVWFISSAGFYDCIFHNEVPDSNYCFQFFEAIFHTEQDKPLNFERCVFDKSYGVPGGSMDQNFLNIQYIKLKDCEFKSSLKLIMFDGYNYKIENTTAPSVYCRPYSPSGSTKDPYKLYIDNCKFETFCLKQNYYDIFDGSFTIKDSEIMADANGFDNINIEGGKLNTGTLTNVQKIRAKNSIIELPKLTSSNTSTFDLENCYVSGVSEADFQGVATNCTFKVPFPKSGAFASRPTTSPIGFKYFCTDKQTVEGATDGIEIIHKGNDVWVDALGRVVS